MNLIVIAKSPQAGRSKTRLCPPCTPEQASELAFAALEDTFSAVMAVPGVRPVVVLEGPPGAWLPRAVAVVPQRGEGLDRRIAAAFDDVGGPAVLIGMDTPQVAPELLSEAVARLGVRGVHAVLGEAEDGGWWTIGLRSPDRRVFLGVPMSTGRTCRAQRMRLAELDLRFDDRLPVLRDVDVIDDARAVATLVPASRFAAALRMMGLAAPVLEGGGP